MAETKKQIAKDLGVTRMTLWRYFNNVLSINPKVAKKVAAYLKCSDDWRLFIEMPGPQLESILLDPSRAKLAAYKNRLSGESAPVQP